MQDQETETSESQGTGTVACRRIWTELESRNLSVRPAVSREQKRKNKKRKRQQKKKVPLHRGAGLSCASVSDWSWPWDLRGKIWDWYLAWGVLETFCFRSNCACSQSTRYLSCHAPLPAATCYRQLATLAPWTGLMASFGRCPCQYNRSNRFGDRIRNRWHRFSLLTY